MGLPPHEHGYELQGTDAWIFYISAFVWIPYTIFFWYLYYEHKSRKQYPQYFIIQFLALGCTCRTVWLFIYPYSNGVWMKVLSRLAMLLQFSAISLLMLMWDRALKVTRQMDRGLKMRNTDASGRESAISRTLRLLAQPPSTRLKTTHETEIDAETGTVSLSSQAPSQSPSEYEVRRELDEDSHERKRVAWMVVNIVAYLVLIGSVIIQTTELVYQINLCCIGVLCLIVDVGILKVGLSAYFRLRKELKPVFMNSSSQDASINASGGTERSKCRTILSYCCCGLDSFLFNWDNVSAGGGVGGAQSVLRMQAQVIRVLLWVSFTVAIFFLIRAFCFIFFPLDPQSVIFNQQYRVGQVTYPLFLYQFPEFFPNLAIAIGISPPKGILRVWIWRIGEYKSQVMRDITRKKWWHMGYWISHDTGSGASENAVAAAAGELLTENIEKSDSSGFTNDTGRTSNSLPSSGRSSSGLIGRISGLFSRPSFNKDNNGIADGISEAGDEAAQDMSDFGDDSSDNESLDSDAGRVRGPHAISRSGAKGVQIPEQSKIYNETETERMRNVSDALEEYIYAASSYASSYGTRGGTSVDTAGMSVQSVSSSPNDRRKATK